MYLKVIKNTLLDTSGNPETLKKIIIEVGKLSTKVVMVGEDFLKAFCKLFCLRICVSSDQ